MILTCPECKARYVVNPSALMPSGRTVRCAKCSHSWFEKKPQDDVEIIPPEEDVEETEAEKQDDAKDDAVAKDKSTEEEKTAPADEEPQKSGEGAGDDFDFPANKPRKRTRPIPRGSNLPALQNQKYGSSKFGWISLAIFVTALICSFMIFQDTISGYWPASKKLYHAIGLDGNTAVAEPVVPELEPIEDRLSIDGITPRRETINNVSNLVIEGYVENISDEQQTIPALKVLLLDENRRIVRDWTFTPETTTVNPSMKIEFVTALPSPPAEARDISVIFTTN